MSFGPKALERLAGKTVFITGASAGIGYATAVEYAHATNGDIKLLLTARREAKLAELKKQLEAEFSGIKVLTRALDVSQKGFIDGFLEELPDEFKDIDILVNNAGKALGRAEVGDIEVKDIEEVFSTNVFGLIEITQAIVKQFKQKNRGDIVQLGSIAGRDAYPGGSIYCSSKFAVRAFTEALRKELINTKIRVLEVQPGAVKTEFSTVRFYGDAKKAEETYAGRTPLVAQDIAEIIVFATSRRENTVIAETLVFPTDQASASHVYKRAEQ